MQAILMCGGKGTRLRPFTVVIPKPLVPLGEMSVLEMVLRQLRHFGFERVILAVGYKAEIIMAVIGDGQRFGLEVTYHYEEKPLGTIGALADMADQLEEHFLVMNGDICTNLNFKAFYQQHAQSGAIASVGTYARHEKIELGVLTVDDAAERIVGFKEKPVYDFLVSMGVNAFHRSILPLIPKGTYFGFDDLMYEMLAQKHDVRSIRFDGLWHDIGRPDDYERIAEAFKSNAQAYLPDGA